MLYKVLIFTFIFGAVVAAPELLQKKTFLSSNDVVYVDYPGYEVGAQVDSTSVVLELISSVFGYKASALTIAVTVIEWVVSNIFVILIGSAAALGFCKITGKCTLNYEEYIPVTQLQGLVTPENIETAERFLITAVEKYAEKKKRSA